MKMFELDYLVANTIKKSVDLGIDPLDAVKEAYRLQKEYFKSAFPPTTEDAKRFVVYGLETFYENGGR